MTTNALYRFFDQDGDLLYIGITINAGNRFKQHRDDKPWWTEVANITIETHPSRADAEDAERQAIIGEKPRYNIIHNRGQNTTRQDTSLRCDLCSKRITGRGYLIGEGATASCPDCLHGGETRHTIHDLAYPKCPHKWHDAWDHGHVCLGSARDLAVSLTARRMPDDCHHICNKVDHLGIYYPYGWSNGLASYQCSEGHEWTCGWPVYDAGSQPVNRGLNYWAATCLHFTIDLSSPAPSRLVTR